MNQPTSLQEQREIIVAEFEAAWRAGGRPAVAEYLEQNSHIDRASLLRDLLQVELELRREDGTPPSLEDYCETFPHDVETVRDVFAADHTFVQTLTDADDPSRADQQPGTQPAAAAIDFLHPPEQPDEIGRLGGYRVLELLGEGGMGVVLRAEDPLLKRQIALKAMKPTSGAGGDAAERFLQEARAAAALNHDHIVTIYQVGEDGGVPFIAMEFLRGESLQSRLERDRELPQAEVVRIGREVAEGLAAAHEQGLIHRDIKPDNIWLEAGRDRAKILDFGLVRVTRQDDRLTQFGMLLGTPRYMSPEQADGQTVDAQSDLFSLGSVLYRMASGVPPFAGKNLTATLVAVSRANCVPIQQRVPDLHPELASLIGQLLQKDPAQRPGSAEEVARALAEIARRIPAEPENIAERSTAVLPNPGHLEKYGNQPTVSLVPQSIEQNRQPARRRSSKPLLTGGAAVAAVLLLLGGLWLAGVVFQVRTAQGTLVVQVEDENFTSSVQGETVTVRNRATGESYTIILDHPEKTKNLQPGEYEFALETGTGLRTRSRHFQITRGEKSIIEAWWEPPAVAAARPEPGRAVAAATGGSAAKPAAVTPAVPVTPAAAAESQPTKSPQPPAVEAARPAATVWTGWPADGPPPAVAPFDAETARQHQLAWAEYLDLPAERTIELGDGVEFRLIFIPPGEFMMGSPESEPDRGGDEDQVAVALTRGFYLGQTEVTQALWESVMGTKPWRETKYPFDIPEDPDYPACCIDWDSTASFCEALTKQEHKAGRLDRAWRYDLPTEAQWEYACRAGTTTTYYFGNNPAMLDLHAWYSEAPPNYRNGLPTPRRVGQKLPNAWGLQDMYGLVTDWCRDGYPSSRDVRYVPLPGGIDPVVEDDQRRFNHRMVYRGGGIDRYTPAYFRSAKRENNYKSAGGLSTGFRVAAVPFTGEN